MRTYKYMVKYLTACSVERRGGEDAAYLKTTAGTQYLRSIHKKRHTTLKTVTYDRLTRERDIVVKHEIKKRRNRRERTVSAALFSLPSIIIIIFLGSSCLHIRILLVVRVEIPSTHDVRTELFAKSIFT